MTNTQIQLACPEKPAGSFYLHETMLVNPITYALFVDALTHDGPRNLSRIGLDTVCNQLVPPGLDLEDLLGTEAMALVLGVTDLLSYGYIGNTEPPAKPYAQSRENCNFDIIVPPFESRLIQLAVIKQNQSAFTRTNCGRLRLCMFDNCQLW
jgi:hypothetical protein